MVGGVAETGSSSTGVVLAFGPFQLFPGRQLLLREGEPVRLGSRAFSLLVALAGSDGALVGKDQLIASVWPDTYVEEANLRVHIAALRKALGDTSDPPTFIANIAGRGYRFVAPVGRTSVGEPPVSLEASSFTPIPPPFDVIGREAAIDALTSQLLLRRSVTITGPGGIGKSTVARAIAHRLIENFDGRVAMADFSATNSVPRMLASALKVSLPEEEPEASLIAFLRSKALLLVLDSCEHAIGEIAALAEAILREAPQVHILSTSIEPLGTEGEWVYRLPALDLPEVSTLSPGEAAKSSAIALFARRAAERTEGFVLDGDSLPYVIEICRRLDCNPLAIEIAAARTDVFSPRELAEHLDDRFELLTGGRRGAAPRHKTLRSLFDWSFEHLTPGERATLRRLSVLRSVFPLDAVASIAGLGATGSSAAADLPNLVRKSLVQADTSDGRTTYRLLDSLRAYASEKAAETGEAAELRGLHARYVEDLLRRAEMEWPTTAPAVWTKTYGSAIDDIRAALDWAFGEAGDIALGVRLTALALPMGLQHGLIDELRGWLDRALERAPGLTPREFAAEIRMHANYGTLAQNQNSVFGSQTRGYEEALALADLAGDRRMRIEPLISYAAFELGLGSYRDALRYAEEASAIAREWGDDLALLGADRVLAQAAAFDGQHERALRLANSVIGHRARKIPLGYGAIAVDRRVSMRIVMARTLWLMGRPIEAAAVAEEGMLHARADSSFAVCQALSLCSCLIALWSGDYDLAERLVNELIVESSRFMLEHWHSWGLLFRSVLDRRFDPDAALSVQPRGALQVDTMVTLDTGMVTAEVAERARRENGWCEPEISRAAALTMRPKFARPALEKALARAAECKALGWQLRIATSLAELHSAGGDAGLARAVLEPVLSQMPEGLQTRDPRRAARVLESLPH